MKKVVIIALIALLGLSALPAQDPAPYERGLGLTLVDLLAPGVALISRGDASGWLTVPGTAAYLGGSFLMASRGMGLFDLHQDGPLAAGMLLAEYGGLALGYNEYWWFEKSYYPELDTPSVGTLLLENFLWDLRSPHELLTLGILGIYTVYEAVEHGKEMKAFFSEEQVPLWGRQMNPWAAAGLMGGFAVLANAMVAPVEELGFRAALIIPMEEAGWPDAASMAASAALFGALHLGNMLLKPADAEYRKEVVQQSIYASFAGLILGWLYLSDDTPAHHVGLGRAMRFHFLNNVLAMSMSFWEDIGKERLEEPLPEPGSALEDEAMENTIQVSPLLLPFGLGLSVRY